MLVLKDASLDDLIATVGAVAAEGPICSPKVAATLLHRVAAPAEARIPAGERVPLTPREREIVRLIGQRRRPAPLTGSWPELAA